MTKIEKGIRQVSDLRDFYIRLQRMKKASQAAQIAAGTYCSLISQAA